ncbi:MAG: hypothetical protein IJY58_05390 [Alphaproteobacteria bacterium]|nr:hypothetical protein [Alphaproteobacteria bacterium]
MKKWQRTLLVGFIWGFIFLWWFIRNFFLENWQFDFFSLDVNPEKETVGWLFLFDEFRKGWVIKDRSTVIFFVVLILAPILFVFGWRFFLKIEWLKLLRRNVNRVIYFLTGGEKIQKKQTSVIPLNKKTSKTTRPRPIDSAVRPVVKESELKVPVDEPMASGGTPKPSHYGSQDMFGAASEQKKSFSSSDSPFNRGFNLPSMNQGFSIAPTTESNWQDKMDPFGGSMDDILLSDIKLPERKKLEENIPELFDNAGYTVLQNVLIGGRPIDYLAVGEQRIVVAVEDTQAGDWLADEERFNGEDPLWFSESSHRVSPIFQLLETVKGFTSRLSENGYTGAVVPLFIERAGIIINAEDMLTTWKDLSVIVCRTELGGPDELSGVADSIVVAEKPSETVLDQVQKSL